MKKTLEEDENSGSAREIADQQKEMTEKPTTTKRSSRKPSVVENTANEEERENVTKSKNFLFIFSLHIPNGNIKFLSLLAIPLKYRFIHICK